MTANTKQDQNQCTHKRQNKAKRSQSASGERDFPSRLVIYSPQYQRNKYARSMAKSVRMTGHGPFFKCPNSGKETAGQFANVCQSVGFLGDSPRTARVTSSNRQTQAGYLDKTPKRQESCTGKKEQRPIRNGLQYLLPRLAVASPVVGQPIHVEVERRNRSLARRNFLPE